MIVDQLTDLTPELLGEYGIRSLFMDFDNTIVPYTTDVPTEAMDRWLTAMQESEIFLCVVSNSRNQRVVRFCNAHGLHCVTRSRKRRGWEIRFLPTCWVPTAAV